MKYSLLDRIGFIKWVNFLKGLGKPKALFIWIPKTAGTSIRNVLKVTKIKNPKLIRYRFSENGAYTFGHVDYNQLIEEGYVSKNFYQTAFTFTFCRNPYARFVSLFNYLKKVGIVSRRMSFVDFTEEMHERKIPGIGLYNVKGLSQCNPQISWVKGLEIDFIGRFEKLEEDVERVADILNVSFSKVPHFNASRHEHYSDIFDPKTKRIVDEIYSEDFEFFGYAKSI